MNGAETLTEYEARLDHLMETNPELKTSIEKRDMDQKLRQAIAQLKAAIENEVINEEGEPEPELTPEEVRIVDKKAKDVTKKVFVDVKSYNFV